MCFAQPAIAVALATLGVLSADVVPHVQAVLMWLLAALVVVGLAIDRRHHGNPMPLAIGALGLAVQIGTLYVYYDWRILTFAYLLIVTAVFLNQNATDAKSVKVSFISGGKVVREEIVNLPAKG